MNDLFYNEKQHLHSLTSAEYKSRLAVYAYALNRGWTLSEIFMVPKKKRTIEYFSSAFNYAQTSKFYTQNLEQLDNVYLKGTRFINFASDKKLFYSIMRAKGIPYTYDPSRISSALLGQTSLILKKRFGFGGKDIDKLTRVGKMWKSHRLGITMNIPACRDYIENNDYIIQDYVPSCPIDVQYSKSSPYSERNQGLKVLVIVKKNKDSLKYSFTPMLKLSPLTSISDNATDSATLVANGNTGKIYSGLPNKMEKSPLEVETTFTEANIQAAKSKLEGIIHEFTFQEETVNFVFSADFICCYGATLLEFNAFPRMDMQQIMFDLKDHLFDYNIPISLKDRVKSFFYKRKAMTLLRSDKIDQCEKLAIQLKEEDDRRLQEFLSNHAAKFDSEESLQSHSYRLFLEGRDI